MKMPTVAAIAERTGLTTEAVLVELAFMACKRLWAESLFVSGDPLGYAAKRVLEQHKEHQRRKRDGG